MDDASYHRDQAEVMLRIAQQTIDTLAASLMRAAAVRHLTQAQELEEKASHSNKFDERDDFSDSFYYRAIRNGIGQALRAQGMPKEPPSERLTKALRALGLYGSCEAEDTATEPSCGPAGELAKR